MSGASPHPTLTIIDYVIFVGTLVVSTLIGIYYGCFGSRQSSVNEYLIGGKKMRMLPIAISAAVSHFSGTLLLSAPAEVVRYGASTWWTATCPAVMGLLGVYIFLPVFYHLPLTSIYEYLEKRFDRKTRMLAIIFYVVYEIMHFPIHVYTPALTFATASGVNLNLTAFILCAVCIFYTTLGGFKTVVWTDFVQFIIIVVSLVTVYVLGLKKSGGFLSIWTEAKNSDRLDFFNFGFDLTQRNTFWGFSLGYGTSMTALLIVHQSGFQKFLALPNFKTCVWSLFYVFLSIACVQTFLIFIGLEASSLYKDCDPLTSKKIAKHDQLISFFITDTAGNIPGISGLFIAATCSAALSSMSSNLNAFCAVVYKDLMCVFLKKKLSKKQTAFVLKLIVLAVGILSTCLVFAIERLGEILTISSAVVGLTQGPLLGAFTLGVLFPRANRHGAFWGTIGGLIVAIGVIVPAKYYQMKGIIKFQTKPLSIAGCKFLNQTLLNSTAIVTNLTDQFQPNAIFRTSFHFYTPIGVLATVIIGLLISYVTRDSLEVDKSLLSPIIHRFLPKDRRDNSVRYDTNETELQLLRNDNREL